MPNKSPFISADTAEQAYTECKNWLRPYFEPINEFERLSRGRPSDRIDPNLPKVTDPTTASYVQETPKRIIQQVPTGLVDCVDYPEYAKIADIVNREDIIPMYNRQGDALQKGWNMLGKSLSWGRSASYTFYTQTRGIMHTDYVIPYAKDVLSEKGKVFAPDSNIAFLRSWYQKRDLKAIIQQEEAFAKNDKNYKSDWNLKLLAEFMDGNGQSKPADLQTASEREKGDGYSGGYEVIHAFQKGIGAESYSFSPMFQAGKPLRTKVTKDPRGLLPIDFLYCNIDLSNPMGRGQVELTGGIQNLIDQQMQMFQFMSTLMMGPPTKAWGNPNRSTMKMRPNALWEMGAVGSSQAETHAIDSFALQSFPNNYSLLKSQIMETSNMQDHSVSAESGNPTQSKTSAGVNASEARLGVSDNYLRKQFESWFSAQTETSVNLYFANMTGKKTKQLKGDDLKELKDSKAAKYIDDKGVLTIPYKDITDTTFKFNVDASSSEVKEDKDNADKLLEIYGLMSKDPDPEIQAKKKQVLKLVIDEIGAEGTDDLFPEMKKTDASGNPVDPQQLQQQQQQPQQPAVTPEMVQQIVMQALQQYEQSKQQQPKPLTESLNIKFTDLPEDAKLQVLEQIGIHSTMPTPQAQTIGINATKASLDIAKTAHDHTMAMHQAAQPQVDPNAGIDPNQPQQPTMDQGQPLQQQPQSSPADAPLSPDETQFVEALTHNGIDPNTIEQAIVMKRRGMPLQQIISAIGAKSNAN